MTIQAKQISPGAANTVLVTNGAATAAAMALLVDANIDVTAAIAVAKLAPGGNGQALISIGGVPTWGNDFGAQNLTTTGGYISNANPGFVRTGLVAGSGSGASASTGQLRMSRTGSAGVEILMAVRNLADSQNQEIITVDPTNSIINFGGGGTTFNTATLGNGVTTKLVGNNSVDSVIGSTNILRVFSSEVRMMIPLLGWNVGGPGIVANDDNANPASANMTFRGGAQTGTSGTNVGCDANFRGGPATGVGADNNTGGNALFAGGGASGATITNVGGNTTIRGGHATGTGAVDGVTDIQTGSSVSRIKIAANGNMGFFAAAPVAQPADIVALTDSTTGTPSGTLVDVGIVFNQGNINNNFASVLTKFNTLRDDLRNLGLMA